MTAQVPENLQCDHGNHGLHHNRNYRRNLCKLLNYCINMNKKRSQNYVTKLQPTSSQESKSTKNDLMVMNEITNQNSPNNAKYVKYQA